MAASPQPPSLYLPKPVNDLSAARFGNSVHLHWTAPKETTDKQHIRGPVEFHLCRMEPPLPCGTVATMHGDPGKLMEYDDTLPAGLDRGALRPLQYQVLGVSPHGRTAGPSNTAKTLAGQAPPRIEGFTATTVEHGVLLRWQKDSAALPGMFVELRRTLSPVPVQDSARSPVLEASSKEPLQQELEVQGKDGADPGMALDNQVSFDRKYTYIAQRLLRQKVGDAWVQVSSEPSDAVTLVPRDTFPPSAPVGLAAVPVPATLNQGQPEIDLSWSANPEPDMAGYLVYRRELAESGGGSTWAQVAPENGQVVVAPTFRDLHVQPGSRYRYAVVAVDQAGNRSARSAEVDVTVPAS